MKSSMGHPLIRELERLAADWQELAPDNRVLLDDGVHNPGGVPRRAWGFVLMTARPEFLRLLADFKDAVHAVAGEYDGLQVWADPNAVPAGDGPQVEVIQLYHELGAWFKGDLMPQRGEEK